MKTVLSGMVVAALALGASAGVKSTNFVSVVQDAPGYNSWPMMQAMGNLLVCGYSRGSAHTIDEGKRNAYVKTSADGGRTWSEERILAADPAIGEVNEGAGLDSTGAALFWVRCWGAPQARRHELYRTTDGVRFEKIASLVPEPFPMQIMDPVIVEGLGLVSPWFAGSYKQDGANTWGLFVSKDDGRTWEKRVIEEKLSVADWVTEPSLVDLGGGRLLVVGRCERQGGLFQVTSVDGGKTWCKRRTNITDVLESTPSLVHDKANGLLCVYYYQRGARQLKRRIVQALTVFDAPLAWPEPEVLAEGEEKRAYDAGNVKATRLGDTDCCAWYTGTETDTAVVVTKVSAPAVRLPTEGIRYVTEGDAHRLDYCKLDLHIPAKAGFPTVVWLHGGGLTDEDGRPVKISEDIGQAVVRYRLMTRTNGLQGGDCIRDAAAAVAWTLKHIAEYGGDPKKVFVSGYSAGGYLTMMVGMDGRYLAEYGVKPTDVAGLVSISGQATRHFNVRRYAGDKDPPALPKVDELAPLHYCTKDMPPILCVCGEPPYEWPGRSEENRLLIGSCTALGHRKARFAQLPYCDHGRIVDAAFPYLEFFVRGRLP